MRRYRERWDGRSVGNGQRALRVVCLSLVVFATALVPQASVSAGRAIVAETAASLAAPVAPQSHRVLLPGRSLRWQFDEQDLQQLYDQMMVYWNSQQWAQVLALLDQISAVDPNYLDIQDRYYYAHCNYGYQLLTDQKCAEAWAEFSAAIALRPDGQEAIMGIDLLTQHCPTPEAQTPTATLTPYAQQTSTPTTPGAPTLTPAPTSGAVTATPVPQVISSTITYTVQAGDTLYSLASRHGTSVQAIMQANGMMNYFLRAGDVILIPPLNTPAEGPKVHIVQPGETVASIAEDYGTTVWAIMSANGLSNYTIYAYRALYIPTVGDSGPIIHIVMPGETLYSIAEKWGTTVPYLMMANGLTTYDLFVYQRVLVPPDEWAEWPADWPGVSPGSPWVPGSTYVVMPGDTLSGIAARFGVSVSSIQSANNLVGTTIYAGQTLRIP